MYRAKRDKLKNRQGSRSSQTLLARSLHVQKYQSSLSLSLCSRTGGLSLGESALLVLFHSLYIFMNIINIIRDCMFLNVQQNSRAMTPSLRRLRRKVCEFAWRAIGGRMAGIRQSNNAMGLISWESSPVSYSSVSTGRDTSTPEQLTGEPSQPSRGQPLKTAYRPLQRIARSVGSACPIS